jgi:hypothetical protein
MFEKKAANIKYLRHFKENIVVGWHWCALLME